jgi:YidC/Oxa1 family membrane protein insertase
MREVQTEIAALYKKHGVSPIMGCLPMLLQLPVFIGLYNGLAYAIELRQTSFAWISDLSKPDRTMALGFEPPFLEPYLNVLPLLMGVIMFAQQLMAPKAADPQQAQQQKIMRIFFLAFPLMFYSVPSGLVLYFLISSLVGMLETRYIKLQLAREDEAAKDEPALALAGGGAAGTDEAGPKPKREAVRPTKRPKAKF